MFDIFWEFNLINAVSFLAFLTTVALFLCGIPICRQIWKRQDTNEISGLPFMAGVLGGSMWLTYGLLKNDQTVIWVTSVQIVLYGTYCIFYFFMSKKKLWVSIRLGALMCVCGALLASYFLLGMKIYYPLGIICLILNVSDFAAPLGNLKVVIRRRATSTMPLPLCIANFAVSSEWFVYGVLRDDFFLMLPNGLGALIASVALFLFVILPRKPGQAIPPIRFYRWITSCGSVPTEDIEKATVIPAEKKEGINKHRWSSRRVISSISDGIDGMMNKAHINDQFAYSSKLNETDDTVTLDSNGSTEEIPPVIFPLTVTNPEQLFALSRHLMNKLKEETPVNEVNEEVKQPPTPELIQVDETSSIKSKLSRWQSAPHLCD
ncbi:Sugar transporter SWEET1 [Aphelenchoides bicaudatus]|nr:Sugar transporter SWEET1 [Aphelenchoides bicaudatus]